MNSVSANSQISQDKFNLRQEIIDAPLQFRVGFGIAEFVKLNKTFKRATFHGEGGSAFPVSLASTIIRDELVKENKVPFEIYQNHTYLLSPEAFNESLNFFCSYSGNTEETILTLKQAIDKNLSAVVIASGGTLQVMAEQSKIPFIKLPVPHPTFQPRMGSGYFIGAILQILISHGFVKDLRAQITASAQAFVGKMGEYEQNGKELADKIFGKTPVVWSSQKFKELARVWTIKFNEHSKNPAFWNFFPELDHNLMVGFTNLGDRYFAIMLKDPNDERQNLRRYTITADILKGYGMESKILELSGGSTFEEMFSSIYIADFAAYYLAGKNNVDPTPVEMVEELKKRLKSSEQ